MTQTIGQRVHFARALRVPAFAWLWSGQAISALGTGTFYVALAWQVLVLTGSGTAMGLVLVAEFTPRIVFVLFGGVLADRVSRRLMGQARRVRRRGILAYGGLVAEGAALIALGVPLPHLSAPAIVISAIFLGGIGTGMFEVIWVSSIQEMVPAAMLGRVTSIDWLGSLCLYPIGLALMGILTDRFGPSWVFLVGGIASVVMNAAALFVPGIRRMD